MNVYCRTVDLFSAYICCLIEGVRARVSQPSFYNSLPVSSIRTFRTYLKENQQELYIEGWPTLTLTPSIRLTHYSLINFQNCALFC